MFYLQGALEFSPVQTNTVAIGTEERLQICFSESGPDIF